MNREEAVKSRNNDFHLCPKSLQTKPCFSEIIFPPFKALKSSMSDLTLKRKEARLKQFTQSYDSHSLTLEQCSQTRTIYTYGLARIAFIGENLLEIELAADMN